MIEKRRESDWWDGEGMIRKRGWRKREGSYEREEMKLGDGRSRSGERVDGG